jgi:hypothetical protein
LALEIFRQCGYLASHVRLSVPTDWHLVTTRMELTWFGAPASSGCDDWEGSVVAFARVAKTRKGHPFHLQLSCVLETRSVGIAIGVLHAMVLSPDDYRVVRRGMSAMAEPPPLHCEGREFVWDYSDRFLFNKPHDHVVSMAVTEAILDNLRQRYPRSAPMVVEFAFHRFATGDSPLVMKILTDDPTADVYEVRQQGDLVCSARAEASITAR